jgi:hypothetical protein
MYARIVNWRKSNHNISFDFSQNFVRTKAKLKHKQRVITLVSKTFSFSVTSWSDLCSNTNIQILSISETNIENFFVLNVYTEKSQKLNSDEFTIDRKLTTIELTKNSIVCEDFNAHHQWWNSRIISSIRANSLITWLNKFNCELINISDKFTFTRETSISVIDLTFATIDLASK